MKKGFTLIELLAVIIILAVVALIATPIVLNIVNDAKESVAKSQAYLILDGANLYYAESIFDNNKKNKIDNLGNIYDDIEMSGKKPENGKLYVNSKGLTAMAVVINNKCYKKEFGGYLQIIDSTDCELGYIDDDEVNPTVDFSVIGNPFNSNGWANQNFYININVIDNESGSYSYKWCSDINDCEPVALVEESNGNALVSTESVNTVVCAIGYDKVGNMSDKTCSAAYKLDKQQPILTVISENIEITQGDDNLVSSYFNVSYGISGGSLSCIPENTNSLSIGNQTITCTATGGNNVITTLDKIITVQSREYIDNSGANAPIVFNNMISVVWNEGNWIRVEEDQPQWYSYDEKVWANAVILNNDVTKNVGDIISESEIAMMYVWIPRYKYTVFNGNNGSVSPKEINIIFESGISKTGTVTCTTQTSGENYPNITYSEICSTINNNVSTYTHPAFTLGDQELTGIWVGKFENSAPNITSNSIQKVIIKPNVQSWRNATISKFYTSIKNISSDYEINTDSHMMKNIEWGAVAYLSHSKYGLCNEIAKNDSSNFYTGRSQGEIPARGGYSTNGTYTYELLLGQLASTTGNIYGIYDMSGGAEEFTMGNVVNINNEFNNFAAEFSNPPENKYYDAYTYGGTTQYQTSRGKLGDATKETLASNDNNTGGWYGDYAYTPSFDGSWFRRGGIYDEFSPAGIFSFLGDNGNLDSKIASRTVLVAE